ncbi:hypothetical protein [uncultured Mycobacterium sp.]|uniref:hypothetical protein n=1 Tax=uncultured Mycobacterium sp. TaxID=171292 RepID=UPI0035C979D1
MDFGIDTKITLLSAGSIFLLALVLGVWKYRQIMAAPDHRAHPRTLKIEMASLIAGEIGGFGVILAGSIAGQFMTG